MQALHGVGCILNGVDLTLANFTKLNPPPTLRSIAIKAGVSVATVSRALRQSPLIPEETRKRIEACAREAGYRPNPFGTAMATRLRLARNASQNQAAIACVHTADPADTTWFNSRFYQRFIRGAHDRAHELGYALDTLYLRAPGMTVKRLARILQTRGIHGMVIPPMAEGSRRLALQWDATASATIGFSLASPRLHYSINHHEHTALLALRRLAKHGYRRIGLAILPVSETLSEHVLNSRFHYAQRTAGGVEKLLPPFPGGRGLDRWNYENFVVWFREHRPEAIATLGLSHDLLTWLGRMKVAVPGEVAVVDMDVHPPAPVAGVDQLHELTGAAAVDLVLEQMHRNERGVPSHPKAVLLEGRWHPGSTMV